MQRYGRSEKPARRQSGYAYDTLTENGRMMGGWSDSSSHASALCASGIRRMMGGWEDDLDERLNIKDYRLRL